MPRYIATLALMPKSALNKSWRYIEGALYMYYIYAHYAWYCFKRLIFHEKELHSVQIRTAAAAITNVAREPYANGKTIV